MNIKIILGGLFLVSSSFVHAVPLTESTFTEVVNTVEIVSGSGGNRAQAAVAEIFKTPDSVETGNGARAELTAPDQTITRVGANTVFSFASTGREINLERGSVLFHSPTGHGGGVIKSGGAAATVSGTTLIVATTPVKNPADKNGFKVILLEGHGRVTLGNGRHCSLRAGEMVFVLPGHNKFGPVLTINLSKLIAGSALVNGFSHQLVSLPLIETAIHHQERWLRNGRASDTGTPADYFIYNVHPNNGPFAGPRMGDPNILQIGVYYPAFVHAAGAAATPYSSGPTLTAGVETFIFNAPPPVNLGNGSGFGGGYGFSSGSGATIISVGDGSSKSSGTVFMGTVPVIPVLPSTPILLSASRQAQNFAGSYPPFPPIPGVISSGATLSSMRPNIPNH